MHAGNFRAGSFERLGTDDRFADVRSARLRVYGWLGVFGALLLGVGMSLCMVFGKMVLGIVVGIIGIVVLLMLIPLTKGLK